MDLEQLVALEQTCDGTFIIGTNGVVSVKTIADRKVEFVSFESGKTLALVKSAMGYPEHAFMAAKIFLPIWICFQKPLNSMDFR
jgi:hypothetical protein